MDAASMNAAAAGVRPPHIVQRHIHAGMADHCIISVQYDGMRFDIHIQPAHFQQSPTEERRCLRYFEGIRDQLGLHRAEVEAQSDPPVPQDFFRKFDEWIVTISRPLFAKYKPVLPPNSIADNVRGGYYGGPLLSQYLFPMAWTGHMECKYGDFSIRIDDRIDSHRGYLTPPKHFVDRLLEEKLWKYAKMVDSARIELQRGGGEEQVFLGRPVTVYADLDGTGRLTLCRFRMFSPQDLAYAEMWLVKYLKMVENGSPTAIKGEQVLAIVSNSDHSFSGMLFA
ncbi:uncharacterized protein E0L32_005219 [Thyridium curvatum]|uniref:Uncharacterized protein n=1 Tax=Thyridium curvatum TaxID=1093900 RepID=A0A507B455_9PEZI|nr:uncharacterized protein E0L32_005219 [Thyridium curvatum]TPX14527.1 hypothetical protein E0L32_005219 [Thyridium curvatum]